MRAGFLSLKWQVAISVSLILFLGIGLITSFGQKNLEETFIQERERILKDRQRSINTALLSIQGQLLHLAGHLQGQAAQRTEPNSLRERLSDSIHSNWDQLNFEWEVDAVLLYGSEQEPWLHLGLPTMQSLLPKEWLNAVYSSESPLDKILCRHSCWQVVAVPVLIDTNQNGVMILVKSLVDAVIEFQQSTAADVGILIPQNGSRSSAQTTLRSLPSWQHDIVALTGGPSAQQALQTLSSSTAFQNLVNQRRVLAYKQQNLELAAINLSGQTPSEQASVLIIEDVSVPLNELNSTIRTLLWAALVILISAEIALLWILWRPMSQLKKVATVLPELARNDRNRLELLPKVSESSILLRNEIHNLQDSSVDLAEKLAEMDEQIKLRTRGLKIRSRELLTEKNFATTLINNVQAIILTQDKDGKIHLINNEGCNLLGVAMSADNQSKDSLNFIDCFGFRENEIVNHGIAALSQGPGNSFQHEGELSLRGQNYYMQWKHSLLPGKEEMILTVGIDLSGRKAAEDNLAWLADHDHLTKLFNRRHFQREFEQILKRSHRNKRAGALFFFDIDQFKVINDTSGHPAGDRLLCEVANHLSLGVRNIDVFARLGGDEFALLVEEINDEGIIILAQKLCDIVGSIEVDLNGLKHKISISTGIVKFPAHGQGVEELMANVDLAMYKAKANNNGRSNWQMYSASSSSKGELVKTVDWQARIRSALDEERLVLYYQPIYNVNEKSISHYEALVRMLDEHGNIIPPGQFIPIAEQTGLIMELDQYVVQQAIKDLSRFQSQGQDIHIAINISAKALASGEFIQSLTQVTMNRESLHGKIIFELTETAAVEDVHITADIINSCKRMGYLFSIDDFGKGYASWFYLRELPVDYVKIDGSFVRNLASSKEDYLFVQAINNVAQGLGKKTVAEFVENAESLELIRELGIDYAQGYYIGKPAEQLLRDEDILHLDKTTENPNKVTAIKKNTDYAKNSN
ncbi:EAL domain-containing protein [uncultured Pseudoteredinibacter sp.]|uniref:bifunctional diguanylate cyclase/phosphodiesterase n=1 Tax=uncultured Pseudoteredinibacter sp. TaxID=1641701 RepID=UPI0026351844|nr:EAL domain-containing protein [uncultured Pseudoteredinibacter sp.]